MLTIFNRTVVYTTYAKENLDKVCDMLKKENIEYTTKTTKSAYDELGDAFQLYVHHEDADKAQKLISEVLFPTKE
ncbi:hypothetical protein [[Eubacterium] hominis]|uniref:hypothetical protein n=1 Tax=[Eubacterium] hominis TaxID=2764325 RepID=UPI003A4E0548